MTNNITLRIINQRMGLKTKKQTKKYPHFSSAVTNLVVLPLDCPHCCVTVICLINVKYTAFESLIFIKQQR